MGEAGVMDREVKRDAFRAGEWIWLRRAVMAGVILTFAMITLGYVLRTNSGAVCPDWPTCYGQWGLPVDFMALVEVVHRYLAALSVALAGLTAVWTAIRFSGRTVLKLALAAAALLMLVQVPVGAGLILSREAAWLPAVHLALGLLALAAQVFAVTLAFSARYEKPRLDARALFFRLALVTGAGILALMISGVLVADLEISSACAGWPLCGGGLPASKAGWLAFGHRLLTSAAAALVIALLVQAWRRYRQQQVVLTSSTALFVLLAGQVFIGAIKVSRGFPLELVGLHAALTAGLWAALFVIIAAALVYPPSAVPVSAANGLRRKLGDFFMLSKPVIVALLLVTTYAGMVVGGGGLPPAGLTLWTMLGGALAAGGASALNQYIDREIDGAMQRTAKRPLPSGRLTPAEALAFGTAACLVSFFLLAGMVNLLAALLSLAGMVYYVLIYSLWLKHATVQNIVIGGGAGAIPPLVGWAAAAGSLNIPSLFLFALVFLWTPPHFWALALVRKKDYARAGVPMLPVIQGERKTRKQIFIYTLELVGLTLVMPLVGLGGAIYVVSAVVLGLWLVGAAWQVLRRPGNKVAWKMYRYSSMYLAFIFLALVLDVLI